MKGRLVSKYGWGDMALEKDENGFYIDLNGVTVDTQAEAKKLEEFLKEAVKVVKQWTLKLPKVYDKR